MIRTVLLRLLFYVFEPKLKKKKLKTRNIEQRPHNSCLFYFTNSVIYIQQQPYEIFKVLQLYVLNPIIPFFLMYISCTIRTLRNTFVKSEISHKYCNCIIYFLLHSWDRPDDGYQQWPKHVTDILNSKVVVTEQICTLICFKHKRG